MIALRDYQQRAVEQVAGAFEAGRRSPLLVLPTGSGKTVIAAELMRREIAAGGRALFLAPRRELVHQAREKLVAFGVDHGAILAGADHLLRLGARAQVASLDTLRARFARGRYKLLDASLILIDEAHLSITTRRQALLERWPDARRVGLTATPTRKDGRALGVLYDALIEPASVAELTRAGYLVPARYFSLSAPDLARVTVRAGDYAADELERAAMARKLIGDVVATWLARAADRRSVIFACGVRHSVALADELLRAGVVAEHVDGATPTAEREAVFGRFTRGETQVLTNCDIATYGFDLPSLSCVVLARPTRSLMRYLQMLGRGLRTAPDKSDCLVLDHSGAVHEFGFAADARRWTLDGEYALAEPARRNRESATESTVTTCPECSAAFESSRVCPECGYVLIPAGRMIATLDGNLVEVGTSLEPKEQERLAFYLELVGAGREHGWKAGAAAHQFRERFGDWPPRGWVDFPAAAPSQSTRRWLQSRLIAWRKRQQARTA